MAKRLLFIYNQYAGKGRIRTALSDVVDIFTKAGYDVTVHPTQCRGDAAKMATYEARNYDMIVCSGGDGTLDETVSGIIRSEEDVTLGYLPAGSTNDYASSLHIPAVMKKSAEVCVNGRVFLSDVGMLNDENFIYVAAFGLFTEVSYETPQEIKNVLGYAAYLLEGVKRLNKIPSYHMTITTNEETIEDDFMFGMITNSVSVGGFKGVTGKHVRLDDGRFEVTLIRKPKNPLELNSIIGALLNYGPVPEGLMHSFKASEIRFESEEEVAWTRDGEFGGRYREAEIEVLHKGLRIMVPEKKNRELIPDK